MAERTVLVKLVADARQYVQGMDDAVRKTKDGTQTIEQQLAAQERAFTQVGTAATAVGVLALAGVTAAVAAYSQFDAAMSGVQAATHESAENMALLSDAALEAGQRTVFSATESAAAVENLARAGISTADILGGALDGALDLAAAGEIEVADAAEIAASAMTQFGLKGQDVTHIADLLAAGAGKAQGGVSDLSQALNQSGLVASQMGLSIEETVGSLTAFASAGLIGSDAGTSFRAMLLRLANPTKESRELMDELGLSVYDSQGQFIGMEALAGQLQERLGGLTQETRNAALAQIFGQDAIRSSSILYEQGAEGIRQWTDAVDEQGYAAETAAIRLDNLKGDLEALGGAFETLMINIGAGADGPLRGIVQGLTGLVEWLGDLDPVAQTALLTTMGLVGAVGLLGGGALLAVPKIAEFRTALATLNITAAGTSGAINGAIAALGGPAIIAIGAATLAIGALVQESERAHTSQAEWNAALERGIDAQNMFRLANEQWGKDFDLLGKTWDGQKFVDNISNIPSYLDLIAERSENAWAALNPANIELDNSGFVSALREIEGAIVGLGDTGLMQDSFRSLAAGMELTYGEAQDLLTAMPDLRDALLEQANAAGVVVTQTDGTVNAHELLRFALGETESAAGATTDAIEDVGAASEDTAEAAWELYDATKNVNDLWFGAQDAMRDYEQGLDDLTEALTGEDALVPALTESRDAFNLDEQAGRDASAMLDGLIVSAQGATDAMVANGDAAEEVAAYQDRAREQIYNAAIQMGLSEDAAREYADRLLAIPDDVTTDVAVNTAAADAAINAFVRRHDGRTIRINTATGGMAGPLAPGAAIARASGGRIPGYALGYDDRIGFLPDGRVVGLGGGEYIVRTAMVDKYLPILEQINAGTFPGYAGGGRVTQPVYQPSFNPVIQVAAPAAAGSTGVVYNDNRRVFNPVAEPDSIAVGKNLQKAASAVGGLG